LASTATTLTPVILPSSIDSLLCLSQYKQHRSEVKKDYQNHYTDQSKGIVG